MADTTLIPGSPSQSTEPRRFLTLEERENKIRGTTPKEVSENGKGRAKYQWQCQAHGRTMLLKTPQCDLKVKTSCNKYNNMYGFSTVSDESWACANCFDAADGTERHPLLSLNKAYQVHCKNWAVCDGMRTKWYDTRVWYTWVCELCAQKGKVVYNDVARGVCCAANDYGQECPVTLLDISHKENIRIVCVSEKQERWDLEASADYKHKDAR